MSYEIKIALNFILSYLYDKLPRRRVNLFGEELEKYLRLKLTSSSSSTSLSSSSSSVSSLFLASLNNENPRCFYINRPELLVDSSLVAACADSAMDPKELIACLPAYLRLYIEPGLVGYTLEPSLTETHFEAQFKILHCAAASPNQLHQNQQHYSQQKPDLGNELFWTADSQISSINEHLLFCVVALNMQCSKD